MNENRRLELYSGKRSPELVTRRAYHTTTAAATNDIANMIQAGDVGSKCFLRCEDAVTGCTSITFGTTGDTNRFGTLIGITPGAESSIANYPDEEVREEVYSAAKTLRLTAVGGAASFGAGSRITIIAKCHRYDKAMGPRPGIS